MSQITKSSASADQVLSEIHTRVVELNHLVLVYQIHAVQELNVLLHLMEIQCVAVLMEWAVIPQDLVDVTAMNVL